MSKAGESTRVIRTNTWLPAPLDALAIEPWHNIAASPYSAPHVIGFSLRVVVLALGVAGPVERESATDQPLRDINAAN